MKEHYYFHHQLVLRTPARPFTLAISEDSVQAALADEEFMEAIYLASPALHAECGKWQRGELTEARKVARLRNTLTRYYARFTSRCTPFGLFAGCSTLRWGPSSRLELRADRNVRHTRLDMHYLCALAQHLAGRAEIKAGLRYWPNTSLYRLGSEIRYVERQYSSGDCVHQISAVEASEFLGQVLALAQPGRTLTELVASLLEDETEQDELTAYLAELVDAQVLVSELEPTVTGAEFFQHLQTVLRRLASSPDAPASLQQLTQTLVTVQQALAQLDEQGRNSAADYECISALLAPLGVPPEAGKLFQTDALHGLADPAGPAAATLDQALQAPLEEALAVLAYLTPPLHNSRLEEYTRRFQARYEDQEVPLLEALDAESGLAYTDYGKSRYSALVHDLVLPETARPARARPRTEAQQWLQHRVQEAERTRQYSVNITRQELLASGLQPGAQPLPPSVAVLFRLIDAEHLLLESVGGSSAVNLLGRFAHASPAIEQLIQELTQHEQAHNPGVRFAEIGHLPASRVGNLLQRPYFRALEIPYLAQSTRPLAQQLPVQDLTLAVRNGQLELHSHQSSQRIMPRLSTAHNFGGDALPVYQLLCDLQTQGLQAQLGISWEDIAPEAKFTPRLTCGRVVLIAATWRLSQIDYQELLAAPAATFAARFAAFRAAWQLPRLFTLADGDNELLVDSDNELLVSVWLDVIRSRPRIVLKEFLFDAAATPVRDAAGHPYVAQFIALLVQQTPCYAQAPVPLAPPPAKAVQREFALGSEWVYYKLYCGQLVADRVLLDVLRPLAAELLGRGLVDTWFFIRYADPDAHLRVRWHLLDPGRVGKVVRLVGEFLAPVSGTHTIWKIQTDTYRRELERYGHRSIACSETLFGYQTQALLERMAQAATDGTLADLWLWGLGAIDELLAAFGYPLARKLALMASLRAAFAQEFGMTKEFKQQLDAKYRSQRAAMQQLLGAPVGAARPLPTMLVAIAQEITELEANGQLEVPLDNLLGSYVHMLLNRLLPADARLHELVLYSFLHRYYQSCQARQPAVELG